jgi:exoribonuclease-2
MIAANETVARFLKGHRLPSLRRVVKTPKRWDKIVSVAAELGYTLPDGPDPKALDNFLVERQKSNPETFPDLSLTVIKLLGSGEYAVEDPDGAPIGHFGLAIREYTHSTAPNRRYPDIITQRQIKAVLEKKENPYGSGELSLLAEHCTRQEDQAAKVERQMLKSAAACYLFDKIGERYPGIVTGNTDKGIWVRILTPPVEGKVVAGVKDLDVGDKVEAQLLSVDIERGFIDFKVISKK